MAELIILRQFSELFHNVKQSLDHYNSNLKNNQFYVESTETNETAYQRGETLFDEYDENLNNLNEILNKEREIIEFFYQCKENKQKII